LGCPDKRTQWLTPVLRHAGAVDGFDATDSLLKGREHFQSLGVEYPVRLLPLSTLAIAAAIVRNERFQIGFAAGSLVYQLSWILRSYDKIG